MDDNNLINVSGFKHSIESYAIEYTSILSREPDE